MYLDFGKRDRQHYRYFLSNEEITPFLTQLFLSQLFIFNLSFVKTVWTLKSFEPLLFFIDVHLSISKPDFAQSNLL